VFCEIRRIDGMVCLACKISRDTYMRPLQMRHLSLNQNGLVIEAGKGKLV